MRKIASLMAVVCMLTFLQPLVVWANYENAPVYNGIEEILLSEQIGANSQSDSNSSSQPDSSEPADSSSSSQPDSSEPADSSSSSQPDSSEPADSSSSSQPDSSEPADSSSSSQPDSSEPADSSSSSQPDSSEPADSSSSSQPDSSEPADSSSSSQPDSSEPEEIVSSGDEVDGLVKQADGPYWDWVNAAGTKIRYSESGKDIANAWKLLWGQYYYFGSDGYAVEGTQYIDGVAYNFNSDFTLRTGELYWDWQYDGGRLRYIVPGQNKPYQGWFGLGGGVFYYFDQQGLSVKGTQYINGVAYNFTDNFVLRTGELYWDWQYDGGRLRYIMPGEYQPYQGWLELWGLKYHFDRTGLSEKGWATIDGKEYYFDPQTFLYVTGTQYIDGIAYNFNSDGTLRTGELYWDWQYDGGRLRYIVPGQHQPYQGWLGIGGDVFYYFDNQGLSVSGTQYINGVAYNFNSNFTLRVGELYWDWQYDGGRLRYIRPGTYWPHTGWLELNNKKYYFDEKGLSVKGTVVIDGEEYTFNDDFTLRMGPTLAIDVSYHQGVIDWKTVASSGVKYAIIRAVGWDRANNTVGGIDTMFDYNVREAKKYGIKVGAYIYTYALNTAEAQVEINAFVSAMANLEKDGYKLDLPVFVDQEDPSLLPAMTYQQRTDQLRYQMVLLEQKGYYPGMYMSTSWSQTNVNAEQLYREGYDMWIADYRTSVQNPVWSGRCAMWQYSSTGSVPGIKGNVDMNYLYKDYSGLIQGSDNTGSGSVAKFRVLDLNNGSKVKEDTMLNLLAAIVNNEVGSGLGLSGNDRTQLYQAQAVAAHSWLLYNYANQAGIPAVGLKYDGNYETIRSQIESVQDVIVEYDGRPALTVYGSCTNGKTNSSGDYWGTSLPYLVAGIESKYDKVMAPKKYFPTISDPRTAAVVSAELKTKHGIDTAGYPDPSTWFVINGRNAGGYITTLTICGKTIKAGTLNDNFSPIRSSDFTVEYNAAADRFTFYSYGNGHGIGLSQYGAAGYIANEGWDYKRVLQHYFPNTTFDTVEH